MEQDSVDLSLESLSEAVGKINSMVSGGTVTAQPDYIFTSSASAQPLKVHGRPVEIKPFEVQLDMAMLEDASSPYNISPETLSNLWVVRFGKEWVGTDVVEEDEQVEFWRHAANRLRELGYLEMHTLASSYRVVLRIVE